MLRNISLLRGQLFDNTPNPTYLSADKFWSNIQNYPIKYQEHDDELSIELLVPGITMEELSVTTKDNTLKIESTKDEIISDFRKVINIPSTYDISTADALLLNGILTVSFQKLKSALPNKVKIRNKQITK
ncbi:MAG: Hsp20/alpha crystallin family protein [SAR202 cluster bacterium]|nr:hypothetical protein [Chloroflexota bacterium]MQG50749.1 Hsp20/alpha crystallin family protein [SAR202 cluster bacterium]|tara:strand:- start:2049 stop:2438 length:390 start_codon:yes stop_codon:yes gene_type:complete